MRMIWQVHHSDDVLRRCASTHVELVNGSKIDGRQAVGVAGNLECVEDQCSKVIDGVMISNGSFVDFNHHSTDSSGLVTVCFRLAEDSGLARLCHRR
ncbi:hypothetical protein MPL3365_210153 [Mesorhizobium plurifarium]|uniref:Uncharacterized protein n=1 Tax=Mesorhizobium plurifarium TaxID=69974 RepID=A0A090GUC3_MESPL|nr:hypothetical protein MPL3365_210153 [Mesorhizobium plurifarium]